MVFIGKTLLFMRNSSLFIQACTFKFVLNFTKCELKIANEDNSIKYDVQYIKYEFREIGIRQFSSDFYSLLFLPPLLKAWTWGRIRTEIFSWIQISIK